MNLRKSPYLPLIISAMSYALVCFDDIRARAPGIGGDIDAMNLRFILRHEGQEFTLTVLKQAADHLEALKSCSPKPQDVDTAVAALRMIPHLVAGDLQKYLDDIA